MSSTLYCYHCSAYHPREQMRQIDTKGGKRWRCIKSIEAAKKDQSERDAFGRRVSAMNHAPAPPPGRGRPVSDR